MDKSSLVRLIGFPATLIHGGPTTIERWRWVTRRLPPVVRSNDFRVIDIGCGTGAFTIGAARRGYRSLGLSWDERNQRVAQERAEICRAPSSQFEILDVRRLDTAKHLVAQFDVALCMECAEHILDDIKLIRDVAACLKPGGRLLFSAPNYYYHAIDRSDLGPFITEETGWHVRRGYTRSMLFELCEQAGLVCEEISSCSGFLSQKLTWLWRKCAVIHPAFALAVTLPFRWLPPLLDGTIRHLTGWPDYSICMIAYKPRINVDSATMKEAE